MLRKIVRFFCRATDYEICRRSKRIAKYAYPETYHLGF